VTARDLLVDVFLVLGVACQIVCCVGVVAMKNVYDRLHYAAAGTTLGPVFVGVAILIRESVSAAGLETIATVVLLFVLNPVVTIATARAAQRLES
jgi:monovalent cation/proton antiporter MnhG/PhaG subunit